MVSLVLASILQLSGPSYVPDESDAQQVMALIVSALITSCRFTAVDSMVVKNLGRDRQNEIANELRVISADIASGALGWTETEKIAAQILDGGPGNHHTVRSTKAVHVQSSPERVIEAYFNIEGERDCVSVWTPTMKLDYNPGRSSLVCSIGSAPCFQLSMKNALHPLEVASNSAFPFRREFDRGDDVVQMFGSDSTFVVVVHKGGIPQASALVDADKSMVLARYETKVLEGRQYVSSIERLEVFLAPTNTQVITRRIDIQDHSMGEPIAVDVVSSDVYFEKTAGSGSVEFRGRLEAIGVPDSIRSLVRLTDHPVAQWLKF